MPLTALPLPSPFFFFPPAFLLPPFPIWSENMIGGSEVKRLSLRKKHDSLFLSLSLSSPSFSLALLVRALWLFCIEQLRRQTPQPATLSPLSFFSPSLLSTFFLSSFIDFFRQRRSKRRGTARNIEGLDNGSSPSFLSSPFF